MTVCEYCEETVSEDAKIISLDRYGLVMCDEHIDSEAGCETCGTADSVTRHRKPFNPLDGSFFYECSECESRWTTT